MGGQRVTETDVTATLKRGDEWRTRATDSAGGRGRGGGGGGLGGVT